MSTKNVFCQIYLILLLLRIALGQCPWHQDVPDLQASCLCAYNLNQELSVQCDQVSEFMSFTLILFYALINKLFHPQSFVSHKRLTSLL